MAQNSSQKGFKYPYLPFATFLALLDRMYKNGVPDRVDRTFLNYTSGVMQSYLISALKGFGLIDEANYKTDALVKMAGSPEHRPQLIGELLKEHYKEQLALGPNATAGMLEETFKPLQGETKRKAITFFLHAAKFAEFKLSPLFKPPRQARSGAGKKTTRRRQGEAGDSHDEHPEDQPRTGDTYTMTLESGVVLSLSVSERLLSLGREDRTFVLDLVDQMQDRASGETVAAEEGGEE